MMILFDSSGSRTGSVVSFVADTAGTLATASKLAAI